MNADMKTYRLGMAASDVAHALDELRHRCRGDVKHYLTPEVEEAFRAVRRVTDQITADVHGVLTAVPVATWRRA